MKTLIKTFSHDKKVLNYERAIIFKVYLIILEVFRKYRKNKANITLIDSYSIQAIIFVEIYAVK